MVAEMMRRKGKNSPIINVLSFTPRYLEKENCLISINIYYMTVILYVCNTYVNVIK